MSVLQLKIQYSLGHLANLFCLNSQTFFEEKHGKNSDYVGSIKHVFCDCKKNKFRNRYYQSVLSSF